MTSDDKTKEPAITVNGQRLSDGEAMTIRVALAGLQHDLLKEDAMDFDRLGKAVRHGYLRCVDSVFRKMEL